MKNEVKDQEDILKTLNEKFTNQETEMATLKACLEYLDDQQKNGWQDVKKEISDENFAKHFNFYLVGFIANDLDYTFERFGPETVTEMEVFKKENALIFSERRIKLGLEKLEDAPLDDNVQEEKLMLKLRQIHPQRFKPQHKTRPLMVLALPHFIL